MKKSLHCLREKNNSKKQCFLLFISERSLLAKSSFTSRLNSSIPLYIKLGLSKRKDDLYGFNYKFYVMVPYFFSLIRYSFLKRLLATSNLLGDRSLTGRCKMSFLILTNFERIK